MANGVLEITDANFETEVIGSDIPVLVDFGAEWCGPCKMLAPTIEELAEDYADKAKIGTLDTDKNHNTAVKFGISSIPTVIVFQNGEVAKQFIGLVSKKDMAAALDDLLK